MGKNDATQNSSELESLRNWMDGKFKEQEGALVDIKDRLERIESDNFEAKNACDELARENQDLKQEVNDLRE